MRSARSPASASSSVLTQPVAVTPARRRSSSSTRRPRRSPTAWNQALRPHVASPSATPAWSRARASSRRSRSPRSAWSPALSLGRVFDSGRFVLPVLGAALLPHALGALGPSARVAGVDRRRARRSSALAVVRGRRARAVDDTFGISHRRHVAGARPPAHRRLAPAAHRARAGAGHRRRAPARGARGLDDGRDRRLARVPPPGDARRHRARTRVLRVDVDARHRRRRARAHRRASARPPARSSSCRTSRCSTAVAAGSCRSTPRVRTGSHPRCCSARGAVVVALLVAPVAAGRGLRSAARRRRHAARRPRGGRSYRAVARAVRRHRRRSSTTSTTASSSRCARRPARLLAHRRARPVLRARTAASGRSAPKATTASQVGLPSDGPGGTLLQQFSHRSARRALAPRRVPSRGDQPRRHARGEVVATRSSPTRSDVSGLDYAVDSELPPLAGRSSRPEQIAATAAPVPRDLAPFTDAARTTVEIDRDRADRATGRRRRRRDHAVRAGGGAPRLLPQRRRSSTTPTSTRDNSSAILEFLGTKRGFCVQFASAYAVMARTLGIPARVAVGFTPGDARATARYHVSSHDAHAWPEIYLAGIGWTHLFDPTPAQQGDTAGGSDLPDDTAAARRRRHRPDRHDHARGHEPAARRRHREPADPGVPRPPRPRPRSRPRPRRRRATPWARGGSCSSCWSAWRSSSARTSPRCSSPSGGDATGDATPLIPRSWWPARGRKRSTGSARPTSRPIPRSPPLELAGAVPRRAGPPTARPLRDLARVYSTARYGDGSRRRPTTRATRGRRSTSSSGALDDGVSWTRRWRRRLDPSVFTRR